MLRRYYELIVENRFPIVLTSPSKNASRFDHIFYDYIVGKVWNKWRLSVAQHVYFHTFPYFSILFHTFSMSLRLIQMLILIQTLTLTLTPNPNPKR